MENYEHNFLNLLVKGDTKGFYTASDTLVISAWPSFQEKQLHACICTNSLAAVQCSGGRYSSFLCALLLKHCSACTWALLLKISSLQTQRESTIPKNRHLCQVQYSITVATSLMLNFRKTLIHKMYIRKQSKYNARKICPPLSYVWHIYEEHIILWLKKIKPLQYFLLSLLKLLFILFVIFQIV